MVIEKERLKTELSNVQMELASSNDKVSKELKISIQFFLLEGRHKTSKRFPFCNSWFNRSPTSFNAVYPFQDFQPEIKSFKSSNNITWKKSKR